MIRRIYFALAFMMLFIGTCLCADCMGAGKLPFLDGIVIFAALWISIFTTYGAYTRGKVQK